jgi:dTDP-4-amino-4,6-dideoxygalactose transaminase
MILARNPDDLVRASILGLHGMDRDAWKRFTSDGYRHYQVVVPGFKYNMMDLQAAIGIEQLKKVERSWRRRREIWERYTQAFKALPITLPLPPEPDTRHAYHLYTVLIDKVHAGLSRDVFLARMSEHKIGVGVHYLSVPEHPYYQERFGWRPQDYPNAMRIGRQTASLPLSPAMSDQDVGDVIEAVSEIFSCRDNLLGD